MSQAQAQATIAGPRVSRNAKTALLLASVALAFFLAIIAKYAFLR